MRAMLEIDRVVDEITVEKDLWEPVRLFFVETQTRKNACGGRRHAVFSIRCLLAIR
jgi:hypothetical protein